VAFCRKTAKRGDILAKNKIAEKRQLGCHFRLKNFFAVFRQKAIENWTIFGHFFGFLWSKLPLFELQ